MAPKHNNVLPNTHFHKDWQSYVKCHFNQPGHKRSRAIRRSKKAAEVAPRPVKGAVRPVVRCPTFKYNTKIRQGRGFTLEELKAAGLSPKYAQTVGIAVDHRRRNKSVEGLQANTQRLQEYKSKLVVLPRKTKKGKKGELPAVDQLLTTVLPIARPDRRVRARAITDEERKANVFKSMRIARANERLIGVRLRRAEAKAAEEAMKKK